MLRSVIKLFFLANLLRKFMDISLENLYCAYYNGSIHNSNAVFDELIDELFTAERILRASDSASSPFVTRFVIARLFRSNLIIRTLSGGAEAKFTLSSQK